MRKNIINFVRLIRPRQWIKNIAIFAAITFTGYLFEWSALQKVILAFCVYCSLSSSIYIVNDIFDREKDRLHPIKKYRPIAHRDIAVSTAIVYALVLAIGAFVGGLFVTPAFFLSIIVYFVMQFLYSLVLKHIAVVDILILAAGYILRVYAGEFATGLHISVWLLLTTISLSLFIAIGKRRQELTLVAKYSQSEMKLTRKSLSHYSERLLDVYASIFATSTFISYALFTFLENPSGLKISLDILMPDFLPDFFHRKWLMITIIPVVYGLMRYLQDIYEKGEGESPEKVFLSDTPLLVTVGAWVLLVLTIIYVIGA